ncbi:hypothetical protein FGIG_05720 [Fasciola gigantica]|uniref:Uncharacterized protein n=1 Tax=Fasciola gigantica TaxID=46835 RepID=A0A504WSX6_FASGI|nr:hypothetical protein FGIG_05720 [Fasciola gigantica]
MNVKQSQKDGDVLEMANGPTEFNKPDEGRECLIEIRTSAPTENNFPKFSEVKSKRIKFPEPPSVDLLAAAELPTLTILTKRDDSDTRRSSLFLGLKWKQQKRRRSQFHQEGPDDMDVEEWIDARRASLSSTSILMQTKGITEATRGQIPDGREHEDSSLMRTSRKQLPTISDTTNHGSQAILPEDGSLLRETNQDHDGKRNYTSNILPALAHVGGSKRNPVLPFGSFLPPIDPQKSNSYLTVTTQEAPLKHEFILMEHMAPSGGLLGSIPTKESNSRIFVGGKRSEILDRNQAEFMFTNVDEKDPDDGLNVNILSHDSAVTLDRATLKGSHRGRGTEPWTTRSVQDNQDSSPRRMNKLSQRETKQSATDTERGEKQALGRWKNKITDSGIDSSRTGNKGDPKLANLCMTMWSYKPPPNSETKLPPLLEALLSGDARVIAERIFGQIRPELNLADQLRYAVREIYRICPKSNTAKGLEHFLGIRPGHKLLLNILKSGQTEKDYNKCVYGALGEGLKHSVLHQLASRTKVEELCKILSSVSSVVVFELIGSSTEKPGSGFPGVSFEAVILNLIKGALYGTDLSSRGLLTEMLVSAGGGINALQQLLVADGDEPFSALKTLLTRGGNPSEALGDLLQGLSDDPQEALRAMTEILGGKTEGIAKLMSLLDGNPSDQLAELIQQIGGGKEGLHNLIAVAGGGAEGIANIMEAALGGKPENDEQIVNGLASIIAAAGGGAHGLSGLIDAAGKEADGLKNILGAAGGGTKGLKNLFDAIGGGTDAALTSLLESLGGGNEGVANLLNAVGGGLEGLKNLLNAVGDTAAEGLSKLLAASGAAVLSNLLKAAGDEREGLENLINLMGDAGFQGLIKAAGKDSVDALRNILGAAGGGLQATTDLIQALGGSEVGLKNLLNAMGSDPEIGLKNLLAATGGGAEGLLNILNAAGGGPEAVSDLLKAIGGSEKDALKKLFNAVGGGVDGLKNLLAASGDEAATLSLIMEAAGGGIDGLINLLGSIADNPLEALGALLSDHGPGLKNLIKATGGGPEGLKKILEAVGGGAQGLANLLSTLGSSGDDPAEALRNLIGSAGGGSEGLANLIGALGGTGDGLLTLLNTLGGGEDGVMKLLETMGGAGDGLHHLLAAFGDKAEEGLRTLFSAAGGGADGLNVLLNLVNKDPSSLAELIQSLGGGPEGLGKLLAMFGENSTEALKKILESMGGNPDGLANLLRAMGLDPSKTDSLKLLLSALGGSEDGLASLVTAMGGGTEGLANLLAALGDDGLAQIIAAAGGGEAGLALLMKAVADENDDGLTNLLYALGSGQDALSALVAAVGGGENGLQALLKAANSVAPDGNGLSALIAAAGGGADGLAALIGAAGGAAQGLTNLLAAAANGDPSAQAEMLQRLIEAAGGGTEGLQNLLLITAGPDGDAVDGLQSLLSALGDGTDAIGILLRATGGGADGLATILAATGGGTETLQLLIEIAGEQGNGLEVLMKLADLENGEQLANVLATAGLDRSLVEAARAGDLQNLTERIRILANEERKKRFLLKKPKDLWPEEKEWLKTRAPGPPSFNSRVRVAGAKFRRMKKHFSSGGLFNLIRSIVCALLV